MDSIAPPVGLEARGGNFATGGSYTAMSVAYCEELAHRGGARPDLPIRSFAPHQRVTGKEWQLRFDQRRAPELVNRKRRGGCDVVSAPD